MAVEQIDAYLDGAITWKEASAWALKVIKRSEWEEWPSNLQQAIHALFDLHDKNAKDTLWIPDKEELLKLKALLQQDRQE